MAAVFYCGSVIQILWGEEITIEKKVILGYDFLILEEWCAVRTGKKLSNYTRRKVVRAGEKVLNLHIPQGGALTLSECRKSIGRAARFFPDFHEITCHSWLLNPNMQAILGPDSNIVQFQSLFEIYELDEDSRQAEERVFPRLEDDPGCYPESTALQRGLKKYLMEGKKIGGAYGRVVPKLQ